MTVQPKTTVKDIFGVLNKSLAIKPSILAIYKAKAALIGDLDSELLTQVQKILAYISKLQSKDPQVLAILEPADAVHQATHFQQCFIAPGAAPFAFPHL